MSLSEDFLASVESYLAEHKMAPSAFGVAVLNDPTFVFELRGGRSPSIKVVERVQKFMAETTAEPERAVS